MAENVTEDVEGVAGKAKNALSGNGNGSITKKLIVPAAAGVGTLVAGYAAKKGPDLFEGNVNQGGICRARDWPKESVGRRKRVPHSQQVSCDRIWSYGARASIAPVRR